MKIGHAETELEILSEALADNYLFSQFKEHELVNNYELDKLVLGRRYDSVTRKHKPFRIDFTQTKMSPHIIVLGDTGSGKTVCLSCILSRFIAAGGVASVVSDIKGQYSRISEPLQSQYLKYIGTDNNGQLSKPQGLKSRNYYPKFLSDITGEKPKNAQLGAFGFSDLTKDDFVTLQGADLTPLQKFLLEDAFKKTMESMTPNIQTFEKTVIEIEEFSKKTKQLLILGARNLIKKNVISDDFEKINFVNDIQNGLVPVLNTKGMITGGETLNQVRAYCAVILRQLYSAKINGNLPKDKPMMVLIDEIKRICPPNSECSSKTEIENIAKLSRSANMILLSSAQELGDINEFLLTQSRYILFPKSYRFDSQKAMMKNMMPEISEGGNWQQFERNLLDLHRDMKQYDFILIDRKKSWPDVVHFFMPLFYHQS